MSTKGLTWSTTVIMKIDLVGPARRGLAMGLNEAAGYGAVAATALATGYIAARAGLRPEPFLLGVAFAGLGLGLSVLFVRETQAYARHEAAAHHRPDDERSTGDVFVLTSFREKALSSCSQAGLVNNLNDGLAWGLFPIFFADAGLSISRIGILAAVYPAVWGLGQLVTGGLSDRIGRKPLIAGGMLTQAVALAWIAATTGFGAWAVGAIVLGAGTAMVYPTLLAAIGDVAHPRWRARSVGIYRLWRDGGFAVGAILAGIVADLASIEAAIWAVAALTAASGIVVIARMYETHPERSRGATTVRSGEVYCRIRAGVRLCTTQRAGLRSADGRTQRRHRHRLPRPRGSPRLLGSRTRLPQDRHQRQLRVVAAREPKPPARDPAACARTQDDPRPVCISTSGSTTSKQRRTNSRHSAPAASTSDNPATRHSSRWPTPKETSSASAPECR